MATAAAGGNDRLGDTLLRDGLLSREQLTQALVEQKASKHRLGFVLVKLGPGPGARDHQGPGAPVPDAGRGPLALRGRSQDPEAGARPTWPRSTWSCRSSARAARSPSRWPTRATMGLLEDLKFITRFDLFPGHRRRVHAPHADREALRVGQRSRSSRTSSRTWRPRARTSRSSRSEEEETVTQAQIEDAPVVKLINGLLTDAVKRGRQRHPLRAVRARDPGALPHRRRAARNHEAAAQDEGGAHLAHQDPLAAQHRRAPRAAGRPHQAQDGRTGSSTSASRRCRCSSARRSCCEFSTRAT